LKDQAELIAISYSARADLTFSSDQEMEKAYRQYVSGWMFDSCGVRPALGRLFTENDDLKPDAHPYAVLSYDYGHAGLEETGGPSAEPSGWEPAFTKSWAWAEPGFFGTEPGAMTDVFIPTMMQAKRDQQLQFVLAPHLHPSETGCIGGSCARHSEGQALLRRCSIRTGAREGLPGLPRKSKVGAPQG